MRILSILLVGFVFALTAYSAEETTSIFNGKDLTGWEGNPVLATVAHYVGATSLLEARHVWNRIHAFLSAPR
jgi:hypothetical protein